MQARLADAEGKAAELEEELQAMTDNLYQADADLEEAEVQVHASSACDIPATCTLPASNRLVILACTARRSNEAPCRGCTEGECRRVDCRAHASCLSA
jgi:hypothetical protein